MADDQKASLFRRESLERLSSPEQLDQLMQVVNAKSWLPLATIGGLVVLVLGWSIFGRIPITTVGQGVLVYDDQSPNRLVGVNFFPPEEGSRIRPGMSLVVVPDEAGSNQMEGIMGKVIRVSSPSITTLDGARQAIAAGKSVDADLLEVLVELEPDPDNPSGYQWTTRDGSDWSMIPGMATTARITVEERAPISFVFPFFEASR